MGTHPDKTRIVLDLDSQSDFRAFTLDNPYRLVVDLPEFSWNAGTTNTLGTTDIQSVRQGRMQPGISRIVFDLKTATAIEAAFILPNQGQKPDRLVIDFKNVPENIFHQKKATIFGKLNPDNAPKQRITPYKTASLTGIAPPPAPSAPRYLTKPLIVIDPGHGGVDPGAIGANNLYEKHTVLKLAKELRKQLENSGQYRVLMTREKDVFIKLGDRVKFARDHEADLFISIHADSLERKNVRGASVYTLSEKASDKQTAMLAARENRADLIAGIDLSVEDEQVANILVDLAMRDTMNQSKFFANTIVNTFKTGGIAILPTTHRYAGFAVLKAPDVPSILVEAGFMSNRQEAQMLNSDSYRTKIARSIKKGIDAYFDQVQKNNKG